MHQKKHRTQLQNQNGFTLIEILVSIIILTFGLLGMVGIQAFALKSNNDSRAQATAVRMAAELGSMVTGNATVALKTAAGNNPYLMGATPPITPGKNCLQSTCANGFEVAQWEIFDWHQRLMANNELASARVEVCFDDAPYGTNGKARWGCVAPANPNTRTLAIKIGWTRANTNSDRSISASVFDTATIPSVVYMVTPGAL